MTYKTKIEFKCCGNVIATTGPDASTGAHTDHCGLCDTRNPDVEVEHEYMGRYSP